MAIMDSMMGGGMAIASAYMNQMPKSMKRAIKKHKLDLESQARSIETAYRGSELLNTAAEKTKLSVLGSLGAEGTYGPQEDPYGANSPFTQMKSGMQIFDPDKAEGGVIDTKAGQEFTLENLVNLGKKGAKRAKKGLGLDVKYVEKRMRQSGLNPSDYDPSVIQNLADNPGSGTVGRKKAGGYTEGTRAVIDRRSQLAAEQVSKNLVNPTKYAEAFFNTSMGRTASMQTAMAEQLVNQSGPLYEKIHRQITAPIYDGAVQLGRESLNVIRMMIGRGGSARRAGLREAMELSNALDIRTQLSDALKESELQMFNTSQVFAQQVTAFNVNLTESLPMISRDYQNSIQSLNEFYTSSVVPAVSALRYSAFKAKMSLEQEKMKKRLAIQQAVIGTAMNIGNDMMSMGSGGMMGSGSSGLTPTMAGGYGQGSGLYGGGA